MTDALSAPPDTSPQTQTQLRKERAAEAARLRRAHMRDTANRALLGLLGFSIFLTGWYVISFFELFRPGLIPAPHEVFQSILRLIERGTLWIHVQKSVWRVAVGVLVGVSSAVPVGFVLGWYETAARLFNPVVNFFRALPPIALIPLVVVYFGIGELARTSVLIYAAFFSGVIVIYEGVRALDPIYIRAAKALGASQFEIFYRIVLPVSIPTILVAFRVALGVSWATLVAAELIAAQQGLGAMIQEAGNFFRIPVIYGGIILIGLAALIMDGLMKVISRRFISWREEVTS
jgi:NitT/TauT family transport system permease protein